FLTIIPRPTRPTPFPYTTLFRSMVSLKSSKTGEWIARKGIPVDARAEYKRLYGVGHEAILRVPAGTSKAQAKARHSQDCLMANRSEEHTAELQSHLKLVCRLLLE